MSVLISYFKSNFENIILSEDGTVKLFTDFVSENNAVKYGVGLYNRSESAIIKLTGKDVLEFLHRITTNSVKDLKPFYYISTLFTNEKGRLIDRTSLVRLEDEYFIVGSKFNDAILSRWIERFIISEDVKVEIHSGNFLILDIIGPQAESYLTLICGKEVDELDDNKIHKVIIDENVAHLLKKKTASGENIYWLISEIENSTKLLDYLLSHKSVFDLEMVGEDAFDRYRVINKVTKGGKEIIDKYNPHEADLLNDVSFNKGCYIGQEVIARLDTYDKVQKILKKFVISDVNFDVPADFYLDNNDKDLLCTVTTISQNHENNQFEGLGFFKKTLIENNSEFDVCLGENRERNFKLKVLS